MLLGFSCIDILKHYSKYPL